MKETRTQTGQPIYTQNLIENSTAATLTSPTEAISPQLSYRSFFAVVTGSGAAASVDIEVSHDKTNWLKLGTLSPTAALPDGLADLSPWPYVHAKVTSNNGTLTVSVGC